MVQNFRLITYGGAADMIDWTDKAAFKSFTHHVNATDPVTGLGMQFPLTGLMRLFSGGTGLLEWKTGLKLSMDSVKQTLINKHRVILHGSNKIGIPLNVLMHPMTHYVCYQDALIEGQPGRSSKYTPMDKDRPWLYKSAQADCTE